MVELLSTDGSSEKSDMFQTFDEARLFAVKSKERPVSIVVRQFSDEGQWIMDHWLRRIDA
jgi:hypothetical protein